MKKFFTILYKIFLIIIAIAIVLGVADYLEGVDKNTRLLWAIITLLMYIVYIFEKGIRDIKQLLDNEIHKN